MSHRRSQSQLNLYDRMHFMNMLHLVNAYRERHLGGKRARLLEKLAYRCFNLGTCFTPFRYVPIPPINLLGDCLSAFFYGIGYFCWHRSVKADLAAMQEIAVDGTPEAAELCLLRDMIDYFEKNMRRKYANFKGCIITGLLSTLTLAIAIAVPVAAPILLLASVILLAMSNVFWVKGAEQQWKYTKKEHQNLKLTVGAELNGLKEILRAHKEQQEARQAEFDHPDENKAMIVYLEQRIWYLEELMRRSAQSVKDAKQNYNICYAVACASLAGTVFAIANFTLQSIGVISLTTQVGVGLSIAGAAIKGLLAASIFALPIVGQALIFAAVGVTVCLWGYKKVSKYLAKRKQEKLISERFDEMQRKEVREVARQSTLRDFSHRMHRQRSDSLDTDPGTIEMADLRKPMTFLRDRSHSEPLINCDREAVDVSDRTFSSRSRSRSLAAGEIASDTDSASNSASSQSSGRRQRRV